MIAGRERARHPTAVGRDHPARHTAPGGRAHIPVDRRAPLAELTRIAADYPVFRIHPA